MSSQQFDPFNITNLKTRQKVDQYLIFGFVRESQRVLKLSIPPLVSYVCLAFYGCIERFIATNHAAIILENKMRIQHASSHDDNVTCYGFVDIPSTDEMIHTWTFRINDIGGNKNHYGVNIGIDSGRKGVNTAFCYQRHTTNYGYYGQGQLTHCDKTMGHKEGYGSNDIIKMQLNLKNKTLSYAKNDGPLEIYFTEIKVDKWLSYCLAIHLRFRSADVSLLSYSAHS